MIRLTDTLAGDNIRFHYCESVRDLREARDFVNEHSAIALDTEGTGVNCFRKGWYLKTLQIGNDVDSYIIPASRKKFISWVMASDTNWIAHNGPHDIRSIDQHLGYRTGVTCAETYIPAHYMDSRGKDEGGTGHKLEELAKVYIDPKAGKWDEARKEAFKEIYIDIPGEVYKSGPRKGMQKVRKAKLSEGWELIDPKHPAMIGYAGMDPINTYRLWRFFQPVVKEFYELYRFDKAVQEGYDELQRRAMRLDVPYTERLDSAYDRRANRLRIRARKFGCDNIQSGDQIANTLLTLGVRLRIKTDSGKFKTDGELLRKLAKHPGTSEDAKTFIRTVLGAKQVEKRKASYTESMLLERDENGRVHPSIRAIAARTTRSSVAGPPFQQLPTKDREDELDD